MNFAFLAGFFGIGGTFRIGWEMLCLPYAEFLSCETVLNKKIDRILLKTLVHSRYKGSTIRAIVKQCSADNFDNCALFRTRLEF